MNAVSEALQEMIGANGMERLREFASYEAGWDFGHGAPMSPRSLLMLECFAERGPRLGDSQPSLFLGREGHLTLAWEDRDGRRVELGFARDGGALLYTGRDDGESVFTLPEDLSLLYLAVEALR